MTASPYPRKYARPTPVRCLVNASDIRPDPFKTVTPQMLILMELPATATEEQYLDRFEKRVRPLLEIDPIAFAEKLVRAEMAESGLDHAQAFELCRHKHAAFFASLKHPSFSTATQVAPPMITGS
jgi:hypothetical protein